jgi:branched-chain amino acid transport system permease protein
MNQFLSAIAGGIASGVPLFLVASGLTLIFGVMGVLNFAHGGFFMIGAYVPVSLISGQAVSLPVFVLAALAGALLLAAIGFVSERLVFAQLYREGHIVNLLASYSILLIVNGAAILVWGTSNKSVDTPDALSGAVRFTFLTEPTYNLFIVAVGVLAALGLWLLLERTSVGIQIRAVAHDRTMARALGVRAGRIGTGVFVLGAALAGLAGALDAPLLSVAPGLDNAFVIQSFAVVIIGGLGSMTGALAAAIVLGLVDSFLVSYLPSLSSYGLYILVAAVLLLRSNGLFRQTRLQKS